MPRQNSHTWSFYSGANFIVEELAIGSKVVLFLECTLIKCNKWHEFFIKKRLNVRIKGDKTFVIRILMFSTYVGMTFCVYYLVRVLLHCVFCKPFRSFYVPKCWYKTNLIPYVLSFQLVCMLIKCTIWVYFATKKHVQCVALFCSIW